MEKPDSIAVTRIVQSWKLHPISHQQWDRGQVFNLYALHFLHMQNRDNNSTYLMGLLEIKGINRHNVPRKLLNKLLL